MNLTRPMQRPDTPVLALAVILGTAAALLTAANPIFGIGAVVGLTGLFIVSRRPEIPFAMLVLCIAIPIQKTIGGVPLNADDGIVVLWGFLWPLFIARKGDGIGAPFVMLAALPLVLASMLSLFGAANEAGSAKQAVRLI